MHLAVLFLTSFLFSAVVITEVSPNPPGATDAIPGDLTHEFIEVYNAGPDTVNLLHFYFTAGSAASVTVNTIKPVVWTGDSLVDVGGGSALAYDSLLPPGCFAVILSRGYVSAPASSRYSIPPGTRIFTSQNKYLRSSGLSNSGTVLHLFSEDGTPASAFNGFLSSQMDPGESATWQRIHPDSLDELDHWEAAPPTPGGPFPFAGVRAYAATAVINEFMCDPQTGKPEWIELFNTGNDTVSLRGWALGGEDASFVITQQARFIPPGGFALLVENPSLDPVYFAGSLSPVIQPLDWDLLLRDADVIVLRNGQGRVIDSLRYSEGWFPAGKGISVERISTAGPSGSPANWRHSLHPGGATPGFKNSGIASPAAFSLKLQNRRFTPGCGCETEKLLLDLQVPSGQALTIRIFDLRGRLVKTFYDRASVSGSLDVVWEGKGEDGRKLPAGPYILYCKCGSAVRKTAVAMVGYE